MDPISAIGVAGSAVGIAGFGLQIAVTLQTYAEAALEADERIRDIANDITAAASALQRLQAVIEQDEKLTERRAFSPEGVKSVNKIAWQCETVFKRTVELLNKAGRPREQLSNSERAQSLTLSTLDHLRWPWLQPKIERCREELERLLLKLLLMLQIANLAQQQTIPTQRHPHDFAKERELRDVIASLSLREQSLTRQLKSAKGEKAKLRILVGKRKARERNSGDFTEEVVVPAQTHVVELMRGASNPPGDVGQLQMLFGNNHEGVLNPTGPPLPPMPHPDLKPQTPTKTADVQNKSNVPQTLPIPRDDADTEHTPPHLRSTYFLEAYLLKGDRTQTLKMLVGQTELRKQLDSILSRCSLSPWDILITLSAKDQADVSYIMEVAKKQDSSERTLAAIEVKERKSALIWKRRRLQHIILFLKIHRDTQSTYTRFARRHLSIEALRAFNIPYEVENDEYVLAKRWIPPSEQDQLWHHTQLIRDLRKAGGFPRSLEPVTVAIEGRKHRHEQVGIKKKRKKRRPGSFIESLVGGRRRSSFAGSESADGVSMVGGPARRDEVVDELLGKWTTTFKKEGGDEEIGKEEEGDEEDGDKDFLESTALDDYFSGDDEEENFSSSTRSLVTD